MLYANLSRFAVAALGALLLAACGPRAPEFVAVAEGFATPEGVRYDPELDLYFVSNINGTPSLKDNNGFISVVNPFGRVDNPNFITGGQNFVTLDAPKGMAIKGDTLWVADIDVLRAFNKRTGQPIMSLDFATFGTPFLNDVAVGPDGALYVTDTGIRFGADGVTHPGPDRIFRVGPDWRITVAVEDSTLSAPNGITWDAKNGRFLVVPFLGSAVLSWRPGDAAPTAVATGVGSFDGIEFIDADRALVSSWADSSLYLLGADSTLSRYLPRVPTPADIGFDTKRGRVAIPQFNPNKVEIWSAP